MQHGFKGGGGITADSGGILMQPDPLHEALSRAYQHDVESGPCCGGEPIGCHDSRVSAAQDNCCGSHVLLLSLKPAAPARGRLTHRTPDGPGL